MELWKRRTFLFSFPRKAGMPIMDNAKSLEGELESAMPSSFTVEEVKQISIPTLLIKGERSPKFLLRIVDILSENMSNTEQITIPGVGHDLGLMSSPDIFNSKVMQFFARHS